MDAICMVLGNCIFANKLLKKMYVEKRWEGCRRLDVASLRKEWGGGGWLTSKRDKETGEKTQD